jgi:hypothetical protein
MDLFLPITKVNEEKRLVYGVAADETPDAADEIFDYGRSKPHFQEWSSKMASQTGGRSLGNVREQHSHIAAGKVTDINFDDAGRRIEVAAHISDDSTWRKVQDGVLTGFSIGGEYADRWLDKESGHRRYEAVPYEISVVDLPANPNAFFSLIKSDGTTEEVPFAKAKTKRVDGVDLPASSFAYVGDPEKTDTWKLPIRFPGDEEKTKSHIRNALARFDQTEGIPSGERAKVHARIVAAARSHGIEVSEDGPEKAAEPSHLDRAVAELAEAVKILSKSATVSGPERREEKSHMDLSKAKSAHDHLSAARKALDEHEKQHSEHVEKLRGHMDKAAEALGSGPAAEGDAEDVQASAQPVGGRETRGTVKSGGGVSREEIEAMIKAAFDTGMQTALLAVKGARGEATAKGIGDRTRIVQRSADTGVIAAPPKADEESDAVLAKRFAAGDQEAGVKLMRSVRAEPVPDRAFAILSGRR